MGYVGVYDRVWTGLFELLRARILPAVADEALGIEHVGSTAVPGLAAKPIIDSTVVVPSRPHVTVTIDRLATLGYRHRGNLGIEDREAFDHAEGLPAHNLYVCPQETLGVINQLAVRDHLRAHPEKALAYGQLKKRLAREFTHDIDRYVYGKTDFVLGILRAAGLT